MGALVLWIRPAWAQEGARRDQSPPAAQPKRPVLTSPPRLLEGAAPEYPPAAAAAGLEAVVKVRLTIDATGAVTDAVVVAPVGNGFDEAALAAARQYRFAPAQWDGVPGAITVETGINFVLQKVETPAPVEGPPARGENGPPPAPGHAGDPRAPVTIEGTAFERGVRRRLSGVIVSVAELGLDAVTDEEGRFFFHGVQPGSYALVAVDEKFDRFRRPLALSAGEKVEVSLYLRPKGGNPYETVVEGEREVLEVTRRTLERRQLTSVPGTFGDPIRVIQTLPGLARTPFGGGFLLIRGSNPDDSGVFIDGHRVPLLFHFLGGPSILNPEFLDRIDLYPGGFPARFGRAIGGIVSVDTRSAKSDGVHGAAKVDLLDSGAYLRVPVGKHGALAVAGRRSYLDVMLGLFVPEQEPGNTLIVVPIYYDYQARLDYDLEREGKATIFLIGSADTLDVLSEDADDEETLSLDSAIRFFRIIGSYRRPIAGGFNLTLSPAWGRDTFEFSSGQIDGPAFTKASAVQETLAYRMRVEGHIGPRVVLDAGLDLESRVNKYAVLAPLDLDVRPDNDRDVPPVEAERTSDMYGFGAHADVAIDVGRLRLVPGLRFDGYFLAGKTRTSLDPRLVARYALDRRWTLKGYVGLFHQPPQPEALDHLFGNPGLGMERALHTGAGAEWKPIEDWTLDGEVYLIDRRNLVEGTNDFTRDPDTGAVRAINFRNSRIGDTIGLEVLVKREVTRKLYGWLSYTLSRTRELEFDDDSYELSTFDQTHVANAVASYRTDNNWELGLRFRLASGRPETPIVGGTFDADDGDYRGVSGEFRGQRRKLFQQTDARVEKTWVFDTWMIGAYLDVQNVMNIENHEAIQYDYRYRAASPVTSVPILPTVGVRGQW
ncbi:MAG TPA: TonB family protein [Kofleriaceae bacterium]|nr:TonB family protein [Kofleriaceae bacterium]